MGKKEKGEKGNKILIIVDKSEYITILNSLKDRNTELSLKIFRDLSKLKKREE